MLVNKILLSPIRENIKCPKALPRAGYDPILNWYKSYWISRQGRSFRGLRAYETKLPALNPAPGNKKFRLPRLAVLLLRDQT